MALVRESISCGLLAGIELVPVSSPVVDSTDMKESSGAPHQQGSALRTAFEVAVGVSGIASLVFTVAVHYGWL
jgi:hypothetical protein